MSDNREQVEVDFNLDLKDSLEKITSLSKAVDGIGSSESISGLVEGIVGVGAVAGALGATFFALKGTLDAVFEAENIKAVSEQFGVLTEQAGIAGDALKSSLKEASGGLATETELLGAANKAIVEMGSSANKLPELMTLARKATSAFGGDLMQNFQNMSQAIATGNMRMLKHMGIVVDDKKAIEDFAKAHGVAENSLSQAGRQQALFSAVLEEGGKKYKSINEDTKQSTNTWKQIKVTFQEVGEAALLAFDTVAGPAVVSFLKKIEEVASGVKLAVKDLLGSPAEKLEAQNDALKEKLSGLEKEVEKFEHRKSQGGEILPWLEDDINKKKSEIVNLKLTLGSLEKGGETTVSLGAPGKAESDAKLAADALENKKIEENALKLHQQLNSLKEKEIAEDLAASHDKENADKLLNQKLVLLHEKLIDDKKKIDLDANLNEAQRTQIKVQLEKNYAAELNAIQAKSDREILQSQQTVLQAQVQAIDSKIQSETNWTNIKGLLIQKQEKEEEELALKIKQIQNNTKLTAVQQEELITASKAENVKKRKALADDQSREEIAALRRSEKENTHSVSAFADGWTDASLEAQESTGTFGAIGKETFGQLTQTVSSSLVSMAEANKFSWAQMRDAMYKTIGEEAVNRGTVMALASVFPPDPAGLAAGAGLTAFGLLLLAKTSGGGGAAAPAASAAKSSKSTGGGGGGANDIATKMEDNQQKTNDKLDQLHSDITNAYQAPDPAQYVAPTKTVSIQVQGHYFETEQTKQKLVELMRANLDATDFKYQQIGGGI